MALHNREEGYPLWVLDEADVVYRDARPLATHEVFVEARLSPMELNVQGPSPVAMTCVLARLRLITIQSEVTERTTAILMHKTTQICHPYCRSKRLHSGMDESDVVPDLSSIVKSVSFSNPCG